ncbi:UDP-N-acetylglucosamine 1-carboxyvinyltransferase [Desulfurivibrio dismutans]|uniref:UDP-N-acetylglucosamine 1-carboxyvinyltransferase n=1 Tax=Desulfurivibrio dismutans TaxID=1398908 RepID=UPI0023DAB5A4|nr:UDP-N-acetylglucosamine 1-carboxyvinyltransferase [Desulfurivibrio alkaliphilus]MDF1615289.1 UDP-N-acetylglucosamine 1-carboxyvinyltransferase [Desulfurivibrio alkaliphilus]
MDKIVIEGGHPLQGEIVISGAKNAALPLICATLLAPGPHVLENVPDLRDTRTMLALLEALGAIWQRDGDTLTIDTAGLHSHEASYDLVKTMRASVLVLGPLLARLGRARVSLPGGCAIGARPINFHLQGFQQLGVRHRLDQGYVEAEVDGRLIGGTVCFDIPSVTATENILMGAVLAKGETVIKNAAREPEIGNLVDMLNGMGARIKGRGSDTLQIEGVVRLRPARIRIVPDRIETGTFLIAVGATGGELTLNNCDPALLPSLYEKLRAAGVVIREEADRLHVSRRGPVRAVDIKTMPYPGFPTDLQAQMMALMCFSNGLSLITETIFENRFMHVAELQRMGADIRIDGHSAIVSGTGRLRGAPVMATDLRASASLVIAGLAAEGTTEISRVYHLDRGYDDLVGKLSRVGAVIHRESE